MPLTLLGQKEITKTFNGIKKIRVTTANGNGVFKKSTNATVTLKLVYTYKDEDYTPSITQEGDELVVKEKFHSRSTDGSADWTLTVPDNLTVKFVTGSGDIEATGLAIDLNATTGSGDFMFNTVSGELECTTGSGDIEIENAGGSIEATSGSGSFRVTKSKGTLKLTTGSGNHKISESSAELHVTTGSGRINCTALVPEGECSFATGSGNAEVQFASSPKHDVSIASGSGDAILNFNGNEINGEIVMRASKKHGSIEAPFEFDKTEEIEHSGNDVTVKKTAVRGTGKPKISISTGSGGAVLKK
jgi:hypothetical protein